MAYQFLGLLNAKKKKTVVVLFTLIAWRTRGFIPFPKGISPKVNVTGRLELELAYYDSAVQCFNHYTTGTTPN